jgi:7-cyano-7-deazaguanine synthase
MIDRPDSQNNALVVFSGGQDSTTCLYWALQHFEEVHALTFSYGQRHIIELESARQIAGLAGVTHDLIELGSVFANLSSLTDERKAIPVSTAEELANASKELPSTFVPGRNIVFLSLAASRAYVKGCDTIVIGVSQEDFAGYPDCREVFVENMQSAISSGLDKPIRIAAPLQHLSKKQTVELAVSLPGCLDALAFSTTCYNGQRPPCGNCNSCVLRARGFAQAGVADPLLAGVHSNARR